MRRIVGLITIVLLLYGCSKTLTAEFAIVKEVNEDSIVIVNHSGITTKLEIPDTVDYTFEENKEYFFRFKHNHKKAVLFTAESNGD